MCCQVDPTTQPGNCGRWFSQLIGPLFRPVAGLHPNASHDMSLDLTADSASYVKMRAKSQAMEEGNRSTGETPPNK